MQCVCCVVNNVWSLDLRQGRGVQDRRSRVTSARGIKNGRNQHPGFRLAPAAYALSVLLRS